MSDLFIYIVPFEANNSIQLTEWKKRMNEDNRFVKNFKT